MIKGAFWERAVLREVSMVGHLFKGVGREGCARVYLRDFCAKWVMVGGICVEHLFGGGVRGGVRVICLGKSSAPGGCAKVYPMGEHLCKVREGIVWVFTSGSVESDHLKWISAQGVCLIAYVQGEAFLEEDLRQ